MKIILAILATIIAASPAMAGTLTHSNGKTVWESTGCQQPAKPMFGTGSADMLNANMEAYNTYAQLVQDYLQCVTREANADMQAVNDGITAQLQQVNRAWDAELTRANKEIGTKRHR